MLRATAVDDAVYLLHDPLCVSRMRNEPLPADVSTLLRILAGDGDAAAQAVRAKRRSNSVLLEAAEFYVTQVLFHPSSDPYRTLGANPNASRDELRANLALLLRWLHPDIGGQRNRPMAERVIEAWTTVKTKETRGVLDQRLEKARDLAHRKHKQLTRKSQRSSPTRRTQSRTADSKLRMPRGLRSRARVVIAGLAIFVAGASVIPGNPINELWGLAFSTCANAARFVSALLPEADDDAAAASTEFDGEKLNQDRCDGCDGRLPTQATR